ncbi:LysM peptidoglycan-binding domain-containing protein [Pararhodospirillum oryzae]|uniref:LysM domain-containing protein n=1 Tax=Pararhodospirillum oryzae TaxID=478448 RepID=A0A512H8P7_9PROT|nr:LysM domain-containing protein [Pararhodospirillum oryzae]GEO81770.1 hypothetical protein ROR02_19010 [Pararhodospirillum oryzae]
MRMTTALMALAITLLTATVVVGGAWTVRTVTQQRHQIATLSRDGERLRAALALAEEDGASLARRLEDAEQGRERALADLATLQRTVDETMVPREVGGSADLPVERAMSRQGETLAAFAARENTTVAVLKALNPWADETRVLQAYQLFWLPKPAPR